MKRITSIVVASLFAALTGAAAFSNNASAQREPGAIFTVPFAFTTDVHTIAAGTYKVNLDFNQHQISIQNLNTGELQFFAVRPELQRAISTGGLLVFHRCGQRKDLTEFHIPGTNYYSATIPPRHTSSSDLERCSASDTTTIAAR
jgi:hypothetical protein